MINESDIQDAITDIRLAPDEFEEIAEDYGIPTRVLLARIEKAYGSLDALAGRANAQAQAEARQAAEREAKISAAVERHAAKYNGTHPDKGKTFIYKGEKFTFVVLSSSHPKYFAKAISHATLGVVGFNRPAYQKYIAPALAA